MSMKHSCNWTFFNSWDRVLIFIHQNLWPQKQICAYMRVMKTLCIQVWKQLWMVKLKVLLGFAFLLLEMTKIPLYDDYVVWVIWANCSLDAEALHTGPEIWIQCWSLLTTLLQHEQVSSRNLNPDLTWLLMVCCDEPHTRPHWSRPRGSVVSAHVECPTSELDYNEQGFQLACTLTQVCYSRY